MTETHGNRTKPHRGRRVQLVYYCYLQQVCLKASALRIPLSSLSTCTVQILPLIYLYCSDPTPSSTCTVQTLPHLPVLLRPYLIYLYCSDPTSSTCAAQTLPHLPVLFRPYLIYLYCSDPTSSSTCTVHLPLLFRPCLYCSDLACIVQTLPVRFRPYLYCSDPTSSSSCDWLRSARGPTSGTELHAALFSPSLTLTLRRNPRRLCSGAWSSKTIVAQHSVTCCFSNTAFSDMLLL